MTFSTHAHTTYVCFADIFVRSYDKPIAYEYIQGLRTFNFSPSWFTLASVLFLVRAQLKVKTFFLFWPFLENSLLSPQSLYSFNWLQKYVVSQTFYTLFKVDNISYKQSWSCNWSFMYGRICKYTYPMLLIITILQEVNCGAGSWQVRQISCRSIYSYFSTIKVV